MAFDPNFRTRPNKYLDTQKELAPQWKAVYKPRVPKTGMSDLLRTLDKKLDLKNYGSRDFANGKYGPVKAKRPAIKAAGEQGGEAKAAQVQATAFVALSKVLGQAHLEIQKIYKKHKWLPAEDAFLKELMEDFKHEATFWVKLAESYTSAKFNRTYLAMQAPPLTPRPGQAPPPPRNAPPPPRNAPPPAKKAAPPASEPGTYQHSPR